MRRWLTIRWPIACLHIFIKNGLRTCLSVDTLVLYVPSETLYLSVFRMAHKSVVPHFILNNHSWIKTEAFNLH